MSSLKLSIDEANNYIKMYLCQYINCSEEMSVTPIIDNKDISFYEIVEKIIYHGELVLKRSYLTKYKYIALLIDALTEKGYDIKYIKPIIRDSIKYEIYFRLNAKEYSRVRSKR